MTGTIAHLAYATALFLVPHVLISGTPVRGAIVRVTGARLYLALYGLVAVAALVWMAAAYNEAPREVIWPGSAFRAIPLIVMPFALILAVAALTTRNPTAAGQTEPLASPARGIVKVTRHPFLWSVVLWAAAHLLANGDEASLIFFGAFLFLGLVGPFLIDAKRRRAEGEIWTRFAAVTSMVPFVAILAGRNRLSWHELGWPRVALALALYGLFLYAHPVVFGVAALPG